MITAKEAHELAEKSRANELEKELEEITRDINRCARGGYNYVEHEDISEAARAALESAGYKVTGYETLDGCAYCTRYTIRW